MLIPTKANHFLILTGKSKINLTVASVKKWASIKLV